LFITKCTEELEILSSRTYQSNHLPYSLSDFRHDNLGLLAVGKSSKARYEPSRTLFLRIADDGKVQCMISFVMSPDFNVINLRVDTGGGAFFVGSGNNAWGRWEKVAASVTSVEVVDSIPKWPRIQEIDQPVTETNPKFKKRTIKSEATTEDWFSRPYTVKLDLVEATKAVGVEE